MANSGVNKIQVKKARDALMSKGVHPSIDAVRVELGNTGSKNTIHRYLKEINDETRNLSGDKAVLSDTLAEMVGTLAAQLQQEAQELVDGARALHQEETRRLTDRIAEQQKILSNTEERLQTQSRALEQAEQTNALFVASQQEFALKAERQSQQLASQIELIAQKDAYIHSLEEKHQHARDALEHYRASVKDQRDQDQRRHEQQLQQLQAEIRQLNQTVSIKQTDITQLNKDNSRLSTEISEVRKQLRASEHSHQLLSTQQKIHGDAIATMTAQLAEAARIQRDDAEEMTSLKQQLAAMQNSTQSMQVELITAKTELNVKNQLFESLHQNFRPQ